MKTCLLDKQQCGRLLWIITVALLACYQINAQVFPLKADKGNGVLVTKSGKPFYLSACSYTPVIQPVEDFSYLLNRWSNLGINTLFVKISGTNSMDKNNDPLKNFARKVNKLKRVIREARLNNMAVMVYPEGILKSDSGLRLFSLLAKKVSKYNNVQWVLDSNDFGKAKAFNSHQLKAIYRKENSTLNVPQSPDFLISQHYFKDSTSTLPHILLYRTSAQFRDSAVFHFRKDMYSSLLKGTSGIILMNYDKNFTAANPLLYQMRLFRNFIDTLQWQDFKPYDYLFNVENSKPLNNFSALNANTNQVLLYGYPPKLISLNLTWFQSDLKFTWIQPSTGKVFNSHVFHRPAQQLFLPPEVDSPDWLLLIAPEK